MTATAAAGAAGSRRARPGPDPVLSLDRVTVLRGGSRVLDQVSVTVRPGEVVAVLGSNGSGKSTLIKSALGLIGVEAGSVSLFGSAPHRFGAWHRVGYLPQRSVIGMRGATVREVVASGRLSRRPPFVPQRRSDRAAIARALEQVDLTDRARQEIALLSGGQQQRALLARALAGEPDLLVLDEPLAGVDLGHQRALADVLRLLVLRGTALLMVLHETGPLADLIDRALVLDAGRVVHDGARVAGSELAVGHDHDRPTLGKLVRGAVDPEDTIA